MKPNWIQRQSWVICAVLVLAYSSVVLAQVACTEAGANAAILSEKELLRRATKRVQPVVPGGFGRIDAEIEVLVLVGADGKVVCAEARERSHPLLRKYCEDAARDWRFRPLKKDGTPVEFAGPIRFRIKR